MDVPPSEVQLETADISDDDTITIVTVVATCFFVAFVAVTLRLISRRLKHVRLRIEDYLAIVALAFAAGLSASIGIDLYAGLGKHIISSSHPETFRKSITATQILYITALISLKISLVVFYRRLFSSPFLDIILWILGSWVVAIGITGDFLAIFNCVDAPTIMIAAHCIDYKVAILFHGAQDVFINLILLCWPIPFIWKSHLGMARKFHIAGVFAIGGFAVAASIIRLIFLINASRLDTTWSNTAPTIWSTVELTMGITACSLATLSPLLRYLPTHSTTPPSRNASFISDTETAVATLPSSGKRTRAVSFKPPIVSPTPKTRNLKSTGADSPGFTWRCSGRPSDLEKWKALPSPPLPPPPALLPGEHVAEVKKVSEEDVEAVFGPHPLFRPVTYGGSI